MGAQSVTGSGQGEAGKRPMYAAVAVPGTVAGFLNNINSEIQTMTSRAVSSGGGETVPSLNYNVFVGKNGDDSTADGSISLPFLTVQAAMEYAWTTYVTSQTDLPFTRPVIFVAAGTYDDGNLVLPPQIMVLGEGQDNTLIVGNWSIDNRWSGADDSRSGWANLNIIGSVDINFNDFTSDQGKLFALDVNFTNSVNLTQYTNGNAFDAFGAKFHGDIHIDGITSVLANIITYEDVTLYITQFGSDQNIITTSGGSIGRIVIDANGDNPGYVVYFNHSVQTDETLEYSGNITIYADISSIPLQSLIIGDVIAINRINPPNFSSNTAGRPGSPYVGQEWFDTDLGSPIWWNGTNWMSVSGNSGVATLDGSGNAIVPYGFVTATCHFVLTIQDTGAVPTTSVYVSARNLGSDFTISSIGGGNAGVDVYWQIYE